MLRVRVPYPWVPDVTTLLFGVILIAVIVFTPTGLVGLGKRVKASWIVTVVRSLKLAVKEKMIVSERTETAS
jgi:hypothetical protein